MFFSNSFSVSMIEQWPPIKESVIVCWDYKTLTGEEQSAVLILLKKLKQECKTILNKNLQKKIFGNLKYMNANTNNNKHKIVLRTLQGLEAAANLPSTSDDMAYKYVWLSGFRRPGHRHIPVVKSDLARLLDKYDLPLPTLREDRNGIMRYAFGSQGVRRRLEILEEFDSRAMDESERTMRLETVVENWPLADNSKHFGFVQILERRINLFNGPIEEVSS